jgi:diguanylate cyclase (GGDEF)-like protein
MIISSVLFISAFTIIQLNNQIDNINNDNTFQANLASIIVKNNLEATIRQADPQDIPKYMDISLKQLCDSNVVKKVIIFDQEGKIIAATEPASVGENVRYKELAKQDELKSAANEDKWFVADIDKSKQNLDLYLALKLEQNNPLAYTAKLSFPLGNIQKAIVDVYKPVIFTALIVILANILFGYILSKTVIGPIKVLNEVTKIIAGGDLSVRTKIQTNDELEELGLTFNYMTEELIKMKERAENANPLTKLPGNIVIREQVEQRINDNQKFVVVYCDLDNFKAFNDKYGIEKGDVAIKLTADIFKEAAKNKGNPDDFLGHEGGDDFLLVTTPDKAKEVTDYITSEFDKRVRSLYSQEDLSQGYIIAHARDGTVKQFPIMTISLAGVTNVHRPITSYGQVTNIAAEVKKKAKAIEGSVFVMDKRHEPPEGLGPEMRKDSPREETKELPPSPPEHSP